MKGIEYSAIASSYDELYGSEQLEKLRRVQQSVLIPRQAIALDLGCGTGLSSSLLECTMVGLDKSIEMLKASHFPRLLRVCGVAENLPFRDKSFDIVISLTAMHNFGNPKRALVEIRRVCKDLVIVSVLRRARYAAWIVKQIRKGFHVFKELDTAKDMILFGSIQRSI